MFVGKGVNFPASVDDILIFINFSHFEKRHAASSTEAYLSALKMYHVFRFGSADQFDVPIVKKVLIGLKNKEAVTFKSKSHRLSMSFDALKVLGHLISNLDWSSNDKIVVWTACLVGYWGSFRLGEILSTTARTPSFHTLSWDSITYPKGSKGVNIFVRCPKTSSDRRGQVTFVASFENDVRYCPVAYLTRLKKITYVNPASPVFVFSSGKYVYTQLIRNLMAKLSASLPVPGGHFGGHSFRAGLPTAMASRPDLFSNREVKMTGKWSSDAADRYMRMNNVESATSLAKLHSLPAFK